MADAIVWTTRLLCDELAKRKNLSTDYQLAKFLGASQTNISGWRKGFRWMNDEWAERLATELGLDPAYVLLCLATERADAKMAGVMRAWLMQHGTAAAVLGAAISGVFVLAALPASAFAAGGLCILC